MQKRWHEKLQKRTKLAMHANDDMLRNNMVQSSVLKHRICLNTHKPQRDEMETSSTVASRNEPSRERDYYIAFIWTREHGARS